MKRKINWGFPWLKGLIVLVSISMKVNFNYFIFILVCRENVSNFQGNIILLLIFLAWQAKLVLICAAEFERIKAIQTRPVWTFFERSCECHVFSRYSTFYPNRAIFFLCVNWSLYQPFPHYDSTVTISDRSLLFSGCILIKKLYTCLD